MLNHLIDKQEFRWSIRKKGTLVFNVCTRFIVLSSFAFGLMTGLSSAALANPTGGTVVGGTATITNTAQELQINQTSNNAIIEWNNFNINKNETTHFFQPSAGAAALNRVTNGSQASAINGNLLANGKVFIINPNGVLIGPTGNIDTAGFIASTADIADSAFMNSAGTYDFNIAGNPDAAVENQGTITVADEGMVALVGPAARNSGVIQGNLAKINLAAGDTFGVDMYGDGLLYLNVAAPASGTRNILAENTGSIITDGGKVLMTVAAASSVVNSVINNTGVIEATSLVNSNGEVILVGGGASISDSGTIDVSGANGGGDIKIGADFLGGGTLPHAATVTVSSAAVLKADATDNGDGGTIIAWSDLVTTAQGDFSAKGGPNGGNGGLIETSGLSGLPDVTGIAVNTSAPLGSFGTWQIDPTTLTINAALAASIDAAVSNVVLTTSDGLSIQADIAMQTPLVSLTLNAGTGGISGSNNFIRTRGGDVTFGTTGAISLNKFVIYTHGGSSTGGNVSLTGDTVTINNNAAIGTGGGATAGSVFINATATSGQKTVSINNSSIDTTGDFHSGGINLLDLTNTPFITGTDAQKAAFFGNTQNFFDSSKPGGVLTIKGVNIGGNSNCFNAGGTLACGVVNDPIPPIVLDVFADPKTKIYGSPDPAFTYTFTGSLQPGDSFTGALARAAGETVTSSPYFINQGTLTVSASFFSYTIDYTGNFLTITPAPLTITALDQSKVYGTTTFNNSAFNVSGLIPTINSIPTGDAVTSVTLASAGIPATATVAGSPYPIVPSAAIGSGLGNYTISYVNGALTVTPAPLTITANDESKPYGTTLTFLGTEFSTGAGQLKNSDSVSLVTLTSTGAPASATVAGSPYPIVPSAAVGSGLGNYTISYVNGVLTVTPAPLTITANDESKPYGTTLTFLGTEFSTGAGQLKNSDSVSSVTLTSTGAPVTATVAGNPYPIVPSAAIGAGLGNYTISYVNGVLTVTPVPLTITANDESKPYGTTLTFLGTEFTTGAGQLKNSDSVSSVTLTSTGAPASATIAGSPYPIVPSAAIGAGLGNYIISYVNGALTVTPALLTITANDDNKVYGTVYGFGAGFSETGLAGSDSISSVDLASTGAPATATVAGSPYPIIPSNATGSGLGNYTIVYVNGAITVTPAPLTITANDGSKSYGTTLTFLGTEFTTGAGQLKNSDTVDSVTLTSTGAPASANVAGSPYPIVPSASAGTGLGNYTISYVDGALTVIPALLNITANSQSMTYGGSLPALTASYSGFVNGDTAASLATPPTLASGTPATANAGFYPGTLTASGALDPNYTITYTAGNLTITPFLLAVLADAESKNFGDPDPALTFTHGTLQNGDTDSVFSGGLIRDPGENPGQYFINQGTLTAGSNYIIDYTGNLLTITAPQLVTIPLLKIPPLTRPIISVDNKAIAYTPIFESNQAFAPIETLTVNANVSIAAGGAPAALAAIAPAAGGGEQTAEALAGVEPAAGGEGKPAVMNAADLANIEPAAGGAVGNDIVCANGFLDNKPCPVQ